MKNKISVIIPFYPIDEDKYVVLQKCVKSLPEHYETIIVWNRREGYAKAINEGAKCATGTHLLIMNDDVEYLSGNLESLCHKDTVASPSYNGRTYEYLWGSCFCIPRIVWDKIGGMDERYTISYFDDDSLICDLFKNGFKFLAVPEVLFDHARPGRTLDSMPDRNTFFEENKKLFIEKWGNEPSVIYEFFNTFGRIPNKGEL